MTELRKMLKKMKITNCFFPINRGYTNDSKVVKRISVYLLYNHDSNFCKIIPQLKYLGCSFVNIHYFYLVRFAQFLVFCANLIVFYLFFFIYFFCILLSVFLSTSFSQCCQFVLTMSMNVPLLLLASHFIVAFFLDSRGYLSYVNVTY